MLQFYQWQELPQVSFLLQQNFCCNKHVFVMTNTYLSQENISFVMTKTCFCNKSFVMTKLCLLQQTCVCHDKTFVATNICHNKHNFVATRCVLSQQMCVCHDKHVFCGDKTFVATKMMLVAAPANDTVSMTRALSYLSLFNICSVHNVCAMCRLL